MAFLQSVAALRKTLGVAAELTVPAAIASMTEQMGLAQRRDDGSFIPLPEQAMALMEILEIDLDSFNCAASERDELDSVSTPAADSSVGGFTPGQSTSSNSGTNSFCNEQRAKQRTLGSFFGPGVYKKYEKGTMVESGLSAPHDKFADPSLGPRMQCECGRIFSHQPAYLVHRTFCPRAALCDVDDLGRSPEDSVPLRPLRDPVADSDVEDAQDDRVPGLAGRSAKRLKNNQGFKRSEMKQGQRKCAHTLIFKYQVALEYEARANLKAATGSGSPLQDTSDLFSGLSKSNVWNWWQQKDKLRAALTHENSGLRGMKNRTGEVVAMRSKGARKLCLHRGSAAT